MGFFRKKPVVIEAHKFTNGSLTFELLQWINSGRTEGDGLFSRWEPENGALYIPTLEGEMTASVDDWIIKGVSGEFYPCKPDIFEKTYELVKDG